MRPRRFKNYSRYTDSQRIQEGRASVKQAKNHLEISEIFIDRFFDNKKTDQSDIRTGLVEIAMGIEIMLKGLLEYYGEEYEEEHTSVYNATLLEALKIPELQKEFLDMLGILMNVDFSYELKQILASEKSAKYNNYYYKSWWLTDAQRLRRMLLRFATKYILTDE